MTNEIRQNDTITCKNGKTYSVFTTYYGRDDKVNVRTIKNGQPWGPSRYVKLSTVVSVTSGPRVIAVGVQFEGTAERGVCDMLALHFPTTFRIEDWGIIIATVADRNDILDQVAAEVRRVSSDPFADKVASAIERRKAASVEIGEPTPVSQAVPAFVLISGLATLATAARLF